jgi:hypothetical protein
MNNNNIVVLACLVEMVEMIVIVDHRNDDEIDSDWILIEIVDDVIL